MFEGKVELALDLVEGRSGQADAAGIGKSLQAHSDVHSIAVYVAFIEDDVTDIDPIR